MLARRWILLIGMLVVLATAGYLAWTRSQASSLSGQARTPVATSLPTADARLQREQGPGMQPSAISLASKAMEFEDLKLRAKRGDPVAQRKLAQVYDACFMPNIQPGVFASGYEQQAKLLKDPGQAPRMIQIAHKREAECRNVDGGAIIPRDLIVGWFEQAARNGDLGAQAMSYALNQTVLDQAAADQFIRSVVGSNDPAAVFLLGNTVGGAPLKAVSAEYKEAMSGSNASFAWMVVGCRMGYDCGPSSDLMESACLFMGACGGGDFEEMVRSELKTDEQRDAFEQKVDEVSRLLQKAT